MLTDTSGFPKTSTQSEYWNERLSEQVGALPHISKNIDSKWVLKRYCDLDTNTIYNISKNIDSKWVLKQDSKLFAWSQK